MVKKLKQMADKKNASAAGLLDSQFAATVRDSAQQIWLAGLGAFSKAQEEGGKVFEALVKEGVTLQKKTQNVAEGKFNEMASKMSGMAGDVSNKAGQHWDKLETIFEERTARALGKLGVPSAKDVAALTKRIDALSEQMAKLGKGTTARTPSRTTPRTAAKAASPAAKPATKATAKRAPRKAA